MSPSLRDGLASIAQLASARARVLGERRTKRPALGSPSAASRFALLSGAEDELSQETSGRGAHRSRPETLPPACRVASLSRHRRARGAPARAERSAPTCEAVRRRSTSSPRGSRRGAPSAASTSCARSASAAAASVFVVTRVEERHEAERRALRAQGPRLRRDRRAQPLARTSSSSCSARRPRRCIDAAEPREPRALRHLRSRGAPEADPRDGARRGRRRSSTSSRVARPFDMQARASRSLDDVLAGLEAMHSAGVGHLDIKPSNVVLREGEQAPCSWTSASPGRKIRPGCGTGPYGAPEVWGVAPRRLPTPSPMAADVYAFGCARVRGAHRRGALRRAERGRECRAAPRARRSSAGARSSLLRAPVGRAPRGTRSVAIRAEMGRETGAERDARHRQRGRSFLVAARSLSLLSLAIGCTSVAPIVDTERPRRFLPRSPSLRRALRRTEARGFAADLRTARSGRGGGEGRSARHRGPDG